MTGAAAQAPSLGDNIEVATGQRPARIERLTGGCVGETYKVALDDGAAAT